MTENKKTAKTVNNKQNNTRNTTKLEGQRATTNKPSEVEKEIRTSKRKAAEAWELREIWLRQIHIDTDDKFIDIAKNKAEEYKNIVIAEENKVKTLQKRNKNE